MSVSRCLGLKKKETWKYRTDLSRNTQGPVVEVKTRGKKWGALLRQQNRTWAQRGFLEKQKKSSPANQRGGGGLRSISRRVPSPPGRNPTKHIHSPPRQNYILKKKKSHRGKPTSKTLCFFIQTKSKFSLCAEGKKRRKNAA